MRDQPADDREESDDGGEREGGLDVAGAAALNACVVDGVFGGGVAAALWSWLAGGVALQVVSAAEAGMGCACVRVHRSRLIPAEAAGLLPVKHGEIKKKAPLIPAEAAGLLPVKHGEKEGSLLVYTNSESEASMVKDTRPALWGEHVLCGVMLATLGAGCVVAPMMLSSRPLMDAPLFPLIRTAVENLSWVEPLALLVLGLIAGVVSRWHPAAIGAASVAVFPVVAIAEMVKDPTSHNLIPFELVMYGFLALPAILGAWAGGVVARRARGADGK